MNTLNEFKKQQSKEIEIIRDLLNFLEMGENLGVEIDKILKDKLLNTINEVKTEKLRVALIGGFSEGKTSIAAAWLEKLDKSTMKISHEESSDEVVVYDVGNDIELVDTPGLFGFKEKNIDTDSNGVERYKDITKKYISEAHLVLYVMNPQNPIKESHKEDLNWLFRTLNLLPRTVFILSKFDLIANPEIEQLYKNKYNSKKEDVIKNDIIHNIFCLDEEYGIVVPTFKELVAAGEILPEWQLSEEYGDYPFDSIVNIINEKYSDFLETLHALDSFNENEKKKKKYGYRSYIEFGTPLEIIEVLQELHDWNDDVEDKDKFILLQASVKKEDFSTIQVLLGIEIGYAKLEAYLKDELDEEFHDEVAKLIEAIKEAKADKHETLHLYDC